MSYELLSFVTDAIQGVLSSNICQLLGIQGLLEHRL
jgi:hypothetical protein